MTLTVDIKHRFAGFDLDVSFEAPAGVTALFGHSGSGKTTVVNTVAGLLTPEAGRVKIDDDVLLDRAKGINQPPHRRRVGYVFQEARLFPHLTVQQNLVYGRWANRLARNTKHEARVVEMLGLGPLLTRRPGPLSGGERQRVALGRALLAAPRILLMDEPLAALDDTRKSDILPYLERLRDDTKLPILYVSHAVSEVARLATTVVALQSGRIVRTGPAAEVLSDPEAVPVLGVQEAGAILEGRVVKHHNDGLTEIAISAGTLFLPTVASRVGADLRIRIAASDVLLSSARPDNISALNVLPVVVDALRLGRNAGAIVRLRLGEDFVLARMSARAAEQMKIAPGQNLYAIVESVAVARGDIGQGHS